MFDSVGFALEDYAALAFMRESAVELGIGDIVTLVPHTEDPKNLFGVLREDLPSTTVSRPMPVGAA